MSEKNALNKEQLKKVTGGEIINASSLEEKEAEAEEIRGMIKLFTEQQKNAKSVKEALELMDKITTLMRELNDLENEIAKAK